MNRAFLVGGALALGLIAAPANQSRDDFLTAAVVARFGVTNRFEINGRNPFVHRSSKSVLAPVPDPNNPNARQLDKAVNNGNLGDVDFRRPLPDHRRA